MQEYDAHQLVEAPFYQLRKFYLEKLIKDISNIAVVAIGLAPDSKRKSSFRESYRQLTNTSKSSLYKTISDPRVGKTVNEVCHSLSKNKKKEVSLSQWDFLFKPFNNISLATAFLDKIPFSINVVTNSYGYISLPGTGKFIKTGYYNERDLTCTVSSDGYILIGNSTAKIFDLPNIAQLELVFDQDPFISSFQFGYESDKDTLLKDWMEALTSANHLVSHHSPSSSLVHSFAKSIIPISEEQKGKHSSVSIDAVPGAIYLSYSSTPRIIAEALVHESDHQWIHSLNQLDVSFWTQDVIMQKPIFRSPWRLDPRPLNGLLLGASAFHRVGMWLNSLRVSDSVNFDYIFSPGSYALLCFEQTLDALNTIEKYGSLSRAGKTLVNLIKSNTKAGIRELEKCQEFKTWELHSQATQNLHNKNWITKNNGIDILSGQQL